MQHLGKLVVAEFYLCDTALLDDVGFIETIMLEAAEKAGARIISHSFHRFSPQGVSGAVIIMESHLAIHTWPEYGYAAVDLFTCGDTVSADNAFHHLRDALGAERVSTKEVHRGEVGMLQRVKPA